MLTTALKEMLRKHVQKLVEPVVATLEEILEAILRAHARTSTPTVATIRVGAPRMLKSKLVVLSPVEHAMVTPSQSATARIKPMDVLPIKTTVLTNKFLSTVRRLVAFVNDRIWISTPT